MSRQSPMRVMFRGQLRTADEIAALVGAKPGTIRARMRRGAELDMAPGGHAKRHPFRGEMLTVREIARALQVRPITVYTRLLYGRELDAPKHQAKTQHIGPPMGNPRLRYAHDIEMRVARLVCGGTCTQQEIATLWNVTRQRVDQIEQRALRKLCERGIGARSALLELGKMRDARQAPRARRVA